MNKRTSTAYWEEKRSRWRIDVQKNGIRKSFYSSTPGRAGKRECHEKADAWLDEGIVDVRKKVKDMAKLYMDDLKCTTSKSHWRQYRNYIDNYIVKQIGMVAMEDLTEQHFQMVINKAYSRGLAKKTLHNMRACEMHFLKFCRKCKVTTLICENINIPRSAVSGNRTILQPDDIRKLMSIDTTVIRGKTEQEHYVYAWRFAVVTGLRPGELLGLMRKDIDDNIVHVSRSLNYYGELTTGKNDNARRSFELHPVAKQIITDQLNYLASRNIVSMYIFPDMDGNPAHQRTYSEHLKKYCRYNGISVATPYELRHTFVSIAKSMDCSLLKSVIGHSATMDTLGVYGHEVHGDMAKAANELNTIFSKILFNDDTDNGKSIAK